MGLPVSGIPICVIINSVFEARIVHVGIFLMKLLVHVESVFSVLLILPLVHVSKWFIEIRGVIQWCYA